MNKEELLLDAHMHTLASGHAYGTIREMANAASEKNIKLIGITDHGPGIPGTCDPMYFWGLKNLPKTMNNVEVLFGAEWNVDINGNLIGDGIFYKNLDYLIVGIHCIAGLYTDQGIQKNTDNLINIMKNDKVKIISHPDSDETPLDYERLAKAAKEYKVALEVNNSSLLNPHRRINVKENIKKMLNCCEKYRCNVIIDSDAHDPGVIANFDAAVNYINEIGFDETLILNKDVDKFKELIFDR